jgi:hypothetical protein
VKSLLDQPGPMFTSVTAWPYGSAREGRLVNRFGAVVWRCTHRHRDAAAAKACAQAELDRRPS